MARVHRQISDDGTPQMSNENVPGLTTQLQVSTSQVKTKCVINSIISIIFTKFYSEYRDGFWKDLKCHASYASYRKISRNFKHFVEFLLE